jgi:hypothetical protein
MVYDLFCWFFFGGGEFFSDSGGDMPTVFFSPLKTI